MLAHGGVNAANAIPFAARAGTDRENIDGTLEHLGERVRTVADSSSLP